MKVVKSNYSVTELAHKHDWKDCFCTEYFEGRPHVTIVEMCQCGELKRHA